MIVSSWVYVVGVFCSVYGLADAGTAFASSYSYPGYQPSTYTSTSGSGTAFASAGSYNPYYNSYYNPYYNQIPGLGFLPLVFPPYRYRRSIDRTDSLQQIQQTRIPPGLLEYDRELHIPSSAEEPAILPLAGTVVEVSPYNVPPLSAPAGISQQLARPGIKVDSDLEQELLLQLIKSYTRGLELNRLP